MRSIEFGAVRVTSFTPPAKYTQICFVDMDDDYNEELCDFDGVACDVWEEASKFGGYESVDENVFLIPPARVKIKTHKIVLIYIFSSQL